MSRRDASASGGAYGMNTAMTPASGKGHGGKGEGKSHPVSPLEELMRRKGVDDAWAALDEMQKQGLKSDRFTVSRMLMKTVGDGRNRLNPSKVYRGIGLVESFVRIQPEEADEVLFNALLDTCCRIKDIGRLDATVQRMKELKIPPSHVTLGILVKAFGQAGDITRVLKVWEDMGEQRRQANAVTYGCMIDACVKCGHMDKAMEIFFDMKRRRKHRNTILYTTLIKGYGLEKDLRNALHLFHEMREEGVPYNTITYNSIIDVCIKCSDVQTAEELLREMLLPGNNIEPDLITYSTLLKGYCHVGDLDKALQVAETIKACGLKCDELVYNTLMDGCVKANDLSAGIGLFAEMTQAGMKSSSITHSILVRLYQRNGYKGDCFDAVALLYQHHGLQKPTGVMERGKGHNNRDDRGGGKRGGRNNNSNNNHQQHHNNGRGDHSGGSGGQGNRHQNHPDHSAAGGGFDRSGQAGGWDHGGQANPRNQPPQGFPGSLDMPPHMQAGGYGGGAPSHNPGQYGGRDLGYDDMDPGMGHPHQGGMPYGMPMDAYGRGGPGGSQYSGGMQMDPRMMGKGQDPYGGPASHGNFDHDRGMGQYMPPQGRGHMSQGGGPPGALGWPDQGGPGGPPEWAPYGGISGPPPHAPHLGGQYPAAEIEGGPPGTFGNYGGGGLPGARRFQRGREDDYGASRMGGQMQDPHGPPPWISNGGWPEMHPGMSPGGGKGYGGMDRMGMDGPVSLQSQLSGVQCGGPGVYSEY